MGRGGDLVAYYVAAVVDAEASCGVPGIVTEDGGHVELEGVGSGCVEGDGREGEGWGDDHRLIVLRPSLFSPLLFFVTEERRDWCLS